MTPELVLIETYPATCCAEVIVLMRRLAYLKATVAGLSDDQRHAWRDVETRAGIIEQLQVMQRYG